MGFGDPRQTVDRLESLPQECLILLLYDFVLTLHPGDDLHCLGQCFVPLLQPVEPLRDAFQYALDPVHSAFAPVVHLALLGCIPSLPVIGRGPAPLTLLPPAIKNT